MRFAQTLALAVVLVLVCSACGGAQAQAQNKPAQYLQIQVTTVKATAQTDYEDFLKKLNAARDKTPGAPRVLLYAVNLGGPAFTYYALTGFETFAERDRFPNGRDMLTKVYGQAEANRLLKIEFDAITQRRTELFTYQADQSTNPKAMDTPAQFLSLQRNELIPEMNGQYANLMRKTKIAQEKAGDKRTIIRRTNAYGTGFTSMAITWIAKAGDRDQTNPNLGEAMRKAFGDAEAAQLQPIGDRSIRNRQTLFMAYRADLSHQKATAGSSN
jgi:hypothetical protein